MNYTLMFFLFISCTGTDSHHPEPNSIEDQKFETEEFTFEYPDNWRKAGLTPKLQAHVEEEYTPDEFRNGPLYLSTNFAVHMENKFAKSLKKAGNNYEDKISSSPVFKNCKILTRENVEFAGQDALEFVGTAEMKLWRVKWKIYLIHYRGKYFEVSSMSEEKRFKDMVSITEPIFESFRFK